MDEDVTRGTRGGDPAVEHDEYAVGERPRLGAVVDDDERCAARAAQRGGGVIEQLGARRRVEAGERLVEQQRVGLEREAAREMHAACLAARERAGGAVGEMPRTDGAQGSERPLATLCARDAPPPQRGFDVRARRAPRERRRLEGGRHLAAPLDGAARELEEAGEGMEERRLAGAVGADEYDHLADVEVEIHAAHDLDPGAGDAGAAGAQRRPVRGHDGRPSSARRSCCWATVRPAARMRISPRRIEPSAIARPYSPADTCTRTALASVCV